MRIVLVAVAAVLLFPGVAAASTELRAPCPGYSQEEAAGCYDTATDTIYYDSRETLWHERGHRFARFNLSPALEQWFARRIGGGAWTSRDPHKQTSGERFAEAFMLCHLRKANQGLDNVAGYTLDGRRHERVCAAIRNVARLASGNTRAFAPSFAR